jgi:hypothetical protein
MNFRKRAETRSPDVRQLHRQRPPRIREAASVVPAPLPHRPSRGSSRSRALSGRGAATGTAAITIDRRHPSTDEHAQRLGDVSRRSSPSGRSRSRSDAAHSRDPSPSGPRRPLLTGAKIRQVLALTVELADDHRSQSKSLKYVRPSTVISDCRRGTGRCASIIWARLHDSPGFAANPFAYRSATRARAIPRRRPDSRRSWSSARSTPIRSAESNTARAPAKSEVSATSTALRARLVTRMPSTTMTSFSSRPVWMCRVARRFPFADVCTDTCTRLVSGSSIARPRMAAADWWLRTAPASASERQRRL